jgi:hypothetical protein
VLSSPSFSSHDELALKRTVFLAPILYDEYGPVVCDRGAFESNKVSRVFRCVRCVFVSPLSFAILSPILKTAVAVENIF